MKTETFSTLKTIPHRPTRPDAFIRDEVLWYLTQNGEVDGREFEVEVKHGVVKMSGVVPTPHLKRMAYDCIKDVPGVIHVENQLRIGRVSRFTDGHSMHGF